MLKLNPYAKYMKDIVTNKTKKPSKATKQPKIQVKGASKRAKE